MAMSWRKMTVASPLDLRRRIVSDLSPPPPPLSAPIIAVRPNFSITCAPLCLGDPPGPAEIFTVVRVSETKIALKSGYGRYVGVNTAGELTGKAEAVGPREIWEPVFEEVTSYAIHLLHLCVLLPLPSFPSPSPPLSPPSPLPPLLSPLLSLSLLSSLSHPSCPAHTI